MRVGPGPTRGAEPMCCASPGSSPATAHCPPPLPPLLLPLLPSYSILPPPFPSHPFWAAPAVPARCRAGTARGLAAPWGGGGGREGKGQPLFALPIPPRGLGSEPQVMGWGCCLSHPVPLRPGTLAAWGRHWGSALAVPL